MIYEESSKIFKTAAINHSATPPYEGGVLRNCQRRICIR
jgi:hypothetical protein